MSTTPTTPTTHPAGRLATVWRWIVDACGSHTFAEYCEDEWRDAARTIPAHTRDGWTR